MSGFIGTGGAGFAIVTNINQKKIEQGKAFLASYSKDVGAESALDVRLRTGAAKTLRYNFCIWTNIPAELLFYKGTTWSATGTALTPSNMKDGNLTSPTFSVYYNSVASAVGTSIIPSPGSDNSRGVDIPAGLTFMTNSIIIGDLDTEYYFKIEERTGSGGVIGFLLAGWEET